MDDNVKDVQGHFSHPFVGVLLSVLSALLVGGSFILQKKGLLRTVNRSSKHAPHTGFAYLQQWTWWLGFLSNAVGEIINFVATTIAPVILITPLGALRVIVSAVLSSIFLRERLNTLGKIGVLLSLVGSTVIVIHAPRQEKIDSFEGLVERFTDSVFLMYCIALVASTAFLVVYVAPKRGHLDIMVYMMIISMAGSIVVLCSKGLGIALKDVASETGSAVYFHPLFGFIVLAHVVGIPLQVVYINKALAAFNTSAVTPLLYVLTNIFIIFGSILLFQEFAYLSSEDLIGLACGFVTIATGVVLLNSFKEYGPIVDAKQPLLP